MPPPKGVASVSPEITRTLSMGTPSAAAAIWPMTVSTPWPCSVTPTAQMMPPLGSSLMTQASCEEIGAPPAP